MNIDIDFETLFSNLLITLRENGINIDKIPYSLIDKYGTILLDSLNKQNISINYILDNENIDNFLIRNKNYYEDSKIDGSIIILKKIPIDLMIFKHQGWLPPRILRSIYNKEVVVKTLEAYIDELIELKEKENIKNR